MTMRGPVPSPSHPNLPDLAASVWQPPRAFALLLLVVLLAVLGFHVALFREWNRAPLVTFEDTQPDSRNDIVHHLEGCVSHGSRLTVRGWVAKRGTGPGRLRTRVLILDRADGRLYAMRTDVTRRQDVRRQLNARFNDTVDYTHAGFSASLNLHAAGRAIVDGQAVLAYDNGQSRAVIPLACEVKWPR